MKKIFLSRVIVLFCGLLSMKTLADVQFTNVTEDDFTNITKEMSANFTHNSIIGASKLGTLFGFQVGVVAAQTATPKLNEIIQRSGGGDLPNLYNAGIQGAVGIPFGLSAEFSLIPQVTVSGSQISANSLALKLNFNEFIPVLPVNLALRGVYSTAKFNFSQTTSGMTTDVGNNTQVSGLQLLVSPMFPVIEPYFGFGLLTGSNDLTVTGSNTVFDPSFTTSQSQKKTVSSSQVILGVEGSLALFKVGAEYSQAFGTNRYAVKFALGF